MSDLRDLPGFRRRFSILAGAGRVSAAVEDDYHCMRVTLHHDGAVIQKVEPEMLRQPWSGCPGARAVLVSTFEGVALAEAASRGMKQANCTHLHDLSVMAARHWADADETFFDVIVSDPVDGANAAEIYRNGEIVLRLDLQDWLVTQPVDVVGRSLFQLRDWIASLDPDRRDAARILQWGAILAHGRQTPLENQSDATRMPPNCYNFQPAISATSKRIGVILDFSAPGERAPLEGI